MQIVNYALIKPHLDISFNCLSLTKNSSTTWDWQNSMTTDSLKLHARWICWTYISNALAKTNAADVFQSDEQPYVISRYNGLSWVTKSQMWVTMLFNYEAIQNLPLSQVLQSCRLGKLIFAYQIIIIIQTFVRRTLSASELNLRRHIHHAAFISFLNK